jgi:hypothetical protein
MFAIDESHPSRSYFGCASLIASVYEGDHRPLSGSTDNLATCTNRYAFIIWINGNKYCIYT